MMKRYIYVLCFINIFLFSQNAIAADNKATDEQISKRYSTIHLSVDSPGELREKITSCIVDAFQSIRYVTFVREYGYNPRTDSYAPRYALHVVVSQIPNISRNDQLALSILIHKPFHAEEIFGILNKSTTTGEPLFEKDVLRALTITTSDQTTIEKHQIVFSPLSNLQGLCKSLASEFDSMVLEKQRDAMQYLKQRKVSH